jgi:hypothetical protein
MSKKDRVLTNAEVDAAERLLERALRWRGLPYYSAEERMALAILAADQRIKGRKGRLAAKKETEHRNIRVNLLLRYVIEPKFRCDEKTARSTRTVMEIIDWLDSTGMAASEPQVRRAIADALKQGPLE